MVEIWYAILALMLSVYLILDGWNIGAGLTSFLVGQTQDERRLVMRSLGPSWSWHEVWLLSFGGLLFMAFPAVYAASFAGFYFAFFLLLWCLLLRGVSLEVRGILDDPMWHSAWDTIFCGASALLALLIGVAAGNVLRGVPLDMNGNFAMALFTDFRVHGQVGLLDWYTIPVGIFTIFALGGHGALYVAVKLKDPLRNRAFRIGTVLWTLTLILLPVITIMTAMVRPDLFPQMLTKPCAWLGLAVLLTGAVALVLGLFRRRIWPSFIGGSLALGGLLISAAAALFPVMLRSTTAGPSLNAYSQSATIHNLGVALGWWVAACVLVVIYFIFVMRHDAHSAYEASDH